MKGRFPEASRRGGAGADWRRGCPCPTVGGVVHSVAGIENPVAGLGKTKPGAVEKGRNIETVLDKTFDEIGLFGKSA